MKWKIICFWLFVFAGLWFFFNSFGTSTFQRQEEVQLFISEWVVIRDILSVPGGFCTLAGQSLVQYYTSPQFVLWVNCSFICAIGFLCYLLLQKITPQGYNLLLALFPVLGLVKAHTSFFYVLDGTVGLFLLLFFSIIFIRIRQTAVQLLYGMASVVFIYGLTGQLTALYGLVVIFMSLLCRREKWLASLVTFLIGLFLTYISIRLVVNIPLTDGIYSERYQESQLQPDSYIYYIWIRFTTLLLILFETSFAMKFFQGKKRPVKIVIASCLWGTLVCFSEFCLPGPSEVRNNHMNELSILEQKKDWDMIIREHSKKETTDYVSLNYLNMALAQKGILGDQLFHYDQKGPQSLLASWDRTYYMSCLLSDIHYMIGDISLSEGYAMEGLTLAKRGGSPRILQRLVKISLIRKDWALANKYLGILGRLPNYRQWAKQYTSYIHHPERIEQDGELAMKTRAIFQPDNLLCLIDLDSLWTGHFSEPGVNRLAWEYLGCSYLLAKKMEKFKAYLLRANTFLQGHSLPVHFQEAALVLAVKDLSVLNMVSVQPEIVQRYKQFQKDISKIQNNGDELPWFYRQYGDTFWFYYYCKKLNE